ncbi:MAG: type II secretion system protein [Verrucomicrobiota bacterium]
MNCSRKHLSRRRGFTLIELMVAVVVLGVILAIAVPGFIRLREASQAASLANDFRVFSHAIHEFHILEGDWPHPNSNPGEFPDGMDGFLSSSWTRMAPIGGYYFFEHQPGGDAQLVLRADRINDHIVELVDKKLDDGNPATGQLVGNGQEIVFRFL